MIVQCKCGQKNRVPPQRVHDGGNCGKCKEPLDRFEKPIHVGTGELDILLASADRPVLVDYWASWCAPCLSVAPELEKLAAKRDDIIVAKFDIDAEPVIAAREKVMGVPTFILYEDGEATKAASGYMTLSQLDDTFPPRD